MSVENRLSFARLGRDVSLYGAAVVLWRIGSFVMLPIYTRLLTPSDYGLLRILDLIVEIAAITLSTGATVGLMRYYFKEPTPEGRRMLVSSSMGLLMILDLIGAALVVLLAPVIAHYLLGGLTDLRLVYITGLNFALSALPSVPLLVLQIEQRPGAVLLANTARLVLQISLNLYFLLVLHWGVMGVLVSTFLTHLVLGLILTIWLVRRVGIHLSWNACRTLERFGIPRQFAAFAMFILTFGDRFVLQSARGLAAVGVYSLAYQFGFLLNALGAASFIKAWTPQRYQLVDRPAAERDALYDRGFRLLTLMLTSFFVAISLCASLLVRIMSDAAFHDATRYIPVLAFAYVANGWAEAVHFSIDVSEQTRYSAYANWSAAAVAFAAYLLLIPPMGLWGAAIATLIAFIVKLFLVHYWAMQLWPVRYAWRRHISILAFGTAVVAIALPLTAGSLLRGFAVSAIAILGYGIVIWSVVLGDAERAWITRALRAVPAAASAARRQAGGVRA